MGSNPSIGTELDALDNLPAAVEGLRLRSVELLRMQPNELRAPVGRILSPAEESLAKHNHVPDRDRLEPIEVHAAIGIGLVGPRGPIGDYPCTVEFARVLRPRGDAGLDETP